MFPLIEINKNRKDQDRADIRADKGDRIFLRRCGLATKDDRNFPIFTLATLTPQLSKVTDVPGGR